MEATRTILGDILAVFTSIGGWIVESVSALMPMFYTAEAGLTFLGVLSVAGLGFSVIFLNFIGRIDGDVNCESALIAGRSCV